MIINNTCLSQGKKGGWGPKISWSEVPVCNVIIIYSSVYWSTWLSNYTLCVRNHKVAGLNLSVLTWCCILKQSTLSSLSQFSQLTLGVNMHLSGVPSKEVSVFHSLSTRKLKINTCCPHLMAQRKISLFTLIYWNSVIFWSLYMN